MQKQLEGLTSSHTSGSESDQGKVVSTSQWTTEPVQTTDQSSKLTTVTGTDSPLTSLSSEHSITSSSSSELKTPASKSVSLPMQNIRHVSPGAPGAQSKPIKTIEQRGLSPYRQMPEIAHGRNQYLSLSQSIQGI